MISNDAKFFTPDLPRLQPQPNVLPLPSVSLDGDFPGPGVLQQGGRPEGQDEEEAPAERESRREGTVNSDFCDLWYQLKCNNERASIKSPSRDAVANVCTTYVDSLKHGVYSEERGGVVIYFSVCT